MKKDDRIYLNFIKQLLAESGQAELVREELSGESEALADGLEDLGKYIKNEKNKLEKICSTDALTGTGNRRAFNQIIDLSAAGGQKQPYNRSRKPDTVEE